MKKLVEPESVYGLNFSKEEVEEAIRKNRLLTLDLETSHVCNLRCIYCYAKSGKKLSNELSLEQLKNTILQAHQCGARIVNIIGGGEPFLYRYLPEIVRHIHELGMKQAVFTNGTLVQEDFARELFDKKVQLVVKVNSMKTEVQDFLTGVPGAGEKALKTLEMLMKIGFNDGKMLGIESIICRQNYDEIPDMWTWARERNIVPYFEMVTFQGRAKDYGLNVPVEDLRVLFEKLLTIDQERFGFTWQPHSPIAALSCKRHYYNLVVAANGYVTPCVGVPIKLGNVKHQSLQEILRSPLLKEIRNIKENIKGACQTCEHNDDCYGCRGMAYNLTGDCFAADPLCWHNPEKINISKNGEIN